MSNTKISQLPVYTGDTSGVYLVMDSADLSATYRVSKETIGSNYATTASNTFTGQQIINNNLSVSGYITGSIVSATNNGNGTNFKVGDDAWIGDVNRVNTLQIMGQEDPLQGYIKFGSGSSSPSFGYGGSNDHVDLSCALKLNQMASLPTATVGTLAVSGSHLYFHNGTGWNQVV